MRSITIHLLGNRTILKMEDDTACPARSLREQRRISVVVLFVVSFIAPIYPVCHRIELMTITRGDFVQSASFCTQRVI